ncbi:succinate dehydrogenase cytochrome b subunit [Tenacibaculum sp. IB213877]|uniref:succinate dehydrogenase cytochrome b subunit n=1 Tax=Tenacibaculum sp. IB213877 TaxID=3097351 RepID=UPI002A5AAB21|nr:succinate dehydrogenase cytochrome b subunit [Tenacibaculum sp. IB213877]MDY0780421.1 succinate dehydrogenase cytochrome b subunit [Tenacibaculum sp. IB213877]
MSGLLKSSIGRKFAMALSAFFLMFFLLQHLVINLASIFPDNGETFNSLSYFMGTNPLVQYLLQPVLLFGVIFHFVMGFVLELRNRNARVVSYAKNNGAANSTWMSRNMIYTGIAILAFMVFHFNDFWVPEIVDKFVDGNSQLGKDYLHHVKEMFTNPIRVAVYVIAFIFLALHLLHGFSSAFQSVGANNKYTKGLETFSKIYAIGVPVGFIIIALFHYFNQH